MTLPGRPAKTATAEILSVPMTSPDTLATLQPGVTYAAIANGFARAHLKMDLIKPASDKPTPAIVFVSGNGWRSVDRASLVPQLSPFAKAGYLVATIDYRIIGEAVFPDPLRDVKTAIRYLRANAQALNIDPGRIGIWGNSAGGQLSAMVATTAHVEDFEGDQWPGHSSAVQAAVLWYPPTDLSKLPGDARFVESAHLGVDVKDPANEDKVRAASPITHVSEHSAPTLIVHGTDDTLVPLAHGERLYEALAAAGVPVTLLKVEGAGHSFGQVSSQPAVMAAMQAFFDRHLKDI